MKLKNKQYCYYKRVIIINEKQLSHLKKTAFERDSVDEIRSRKFMEHIWITLRWEKLNFRINFDIRIPASFLFSKLTLRRIYRIR